jgi:hypothetical protein
MSYRPKHYGVWCQANGFDPEEDHADDEFWYTLWVLARAEEYRKLHGMSRLDHAPTDGSFERYMAEFAASQPGNGGA